MTIGPLVPGSPTTVTPDLGHAGYTSAQGPGPDFQYEADDILQVLQVALNVQAKADSHLLSGTVAQMVALANVQAGWQFDAADYGRYYATLSSQDFGLPWTQTSTGTAGIYWRHANTYLLRQKADGSGGLSDVGLCRVGPMTGIDAGTPSGRIPKSVVQNHIHDSGQLNRATLFTMTASSTETELANVISFASLLAGDVITGCIGPLIVLTNASDTARVRLEFVDNYGGTPITDEVSNFYPYLVGPSLGVTTVTLPFRHEVQAAGTTSVWIRITAGNAALQVSGADTNSSTYGVGNYLTYRP